MAKIIADSGCDILDIFKSKDFTSFSSIPLKLHMDGNEYIDDGSMDIDTYLNLMENSKSGSKSSAPSPDDFLSAFEDSKEVYIVTISQKLSGSYNSANVAKNMYQELYPDRFVHVFDSKGATATETLIVLKLNEAIKKNLPPDEVVKEINTVISNLNLYFILEKYENLVKNGRMNPYIAKFASTLSIRPICYADDGEVGLLEKARGTKAYSKLVKIMTDHNLPKIAAEIKSEFSVVITHVKCLDTALHMKSLIEEKFNIRDFHIAEPTMLCTNYGERNGIMIAIVKA
ncbi:MAG: DegV family protein [Lachnospirales bacterium]